MHLALYRSERPEVFDEIIGQKHIVKILRNQLKSGTVSQAYLFTGTRGTGKTTTARILAKAVNCTADIPEAAKPCGKCAACEAIRQGRFLDCLELDAASNNGVDDLRAIIDSVQYPPAVGRYKVYIIDEVHMLSQSAENAFLKTLEEPPPYAIFVLATTNPEKVRATIRSRCMTLGFKRVSENELVDGMKRICERKGQAITDEALGVVAARADGSVRDALSILEQCISAGDELVTRELVLDYIGCAGTEFYLSLADAVLAGDAASVLASIDQAIREGKDARQLLSDALSHYRDLMVVKYVDEPTGVVGVSAENVARLRQQAERMQAKELEYAIRLLSEYLNLGRYSTQPRILLETAMIQLMSGESESLVRAAAPSPGKTAARPARPAAGIASATSDAPGRAAAPSTPIRPVHPEEWSEKGNPGETVPAKSAVFQNNNHNRVPEGAGSAAAVEEPQPGRPADPPQQAAPAGPDLTGIWERMTDAISRGDLSYGIMVGQNSRIDYYKNNELRVIVKKNKLGIAENYKAEMERVAKSLLGASTYVTLKAGDPATMKAARAPEPEAEPEEERPGHASPDFGPEAVFEDMPQDDTEQNVMSEDQYLEELAEGASAFFGMPVEIID